MNPVPAFPSVADAMSAVQAGLRFVAAADATQMSAHAQAEALQMMERASAIVTAARASVLSAFTAGQGYTADAAYSPRAWLIHQTRVTKVVAVAHAAWAQRTVTHPQVVAALAAGDLSESYGRAICRWTDQLPPDCRPAADAILLSAAAAGMDLRDLAGLAAEMYERSRPDLPDQDPARAFEDRAVRLETTFGGAGVLTGDLTPECAAVVGAVLDALGAPAGAEDSRSHAQRYHDALLEDLIRLCTELGHLRRHAAAGTGQDDGAPEPGGDGGPGTARSQDALTQAVIGAAVDLLSGPGGLASFLRRRQLGARLGGPSLPLDVGVSRDIPAAIRRAVILRDQHCRFPAGCDQPAAACEVHHLRHQAHGGPASVTGCALFCFYHHQIVIHQQGWTVILNPDGTTTAWNKDKTKIIHSHSPPARPG